VDEQINNMSMNDNISGEPLMFSLLDKTPQTDLKIHCQAPSEEVKDNWTTQLRSILDMQGDFLRGRCIGPVPTYYAAARLAMQTRHLLFWILVESPLVHFPKDIRHFRRYLTCGKLDFSVLAFGGKEKERLRQFSFFCKFCFRD